MRPRGWLAIGLCFALMWSAKARAQATDSELLDKVVVGEPVAEPDAGTLDETPEPAAQIADQQPLPTGDEQARIAWTNLDPAREGAGVATASVDVGVLDPTAASAHQRAGGAGFTFQIVARRKSWPLMVGLGIGIMALGGQVGAGPYYSGSTQNGGSYTGSTHQDTSLELRHGEIVTRLQPWWWWVRPYIEGEFGVLGLWNTSKLSNSAGDTLYAREKQRSVSFLAGVGAGIDIRLWRTANTDIVNRFEFILSLGIKRVYSGKLSSTVYTDAPDPSVQHDRERLRMWQPYLSFGFAGASKPRPKEYPAPKPYVAP